MAFYTQLTLAFTWRTRAKLKGMRVLFFYKEPSDHG